MKRYTTPTHQSCVMCGSKDMTVAYHTFSMDADKPFKRRASDNRVLKSFWVKVWVDKCGACGEVYIANEASKIIEEEARKHGWYK